MKRPVDRNGKPINPNAAVRLIATYHPLLDVIGFKPHGIVVTKYPSGEQREHPAKELRVVAG